MGGVFDGTTWWARYAVADPPSGPLPLKDFEHPGLCTCLLLVAVIFGSYLPLHRRRDRVLRCAVRNVLTSVAPARSRTWRHLPVLLGLSALVLLTGALAGHISDVRIPAIVPWLF